MYMRLKEYRDRREYSPEIRNAVKELEFARMCEQWRQQLEKPNIPGEYTKMAIVPRLEAWMFHDCGEMSFHLS